MTTLAGLLDSYLDLQWHFDPAAASAAGIVSADARLGAFDASSVREHLAAVRSVAGAVEDLEIDDLEQEIDRTALLGEARGLLARFEQERPHVRDPGFWVDHAHSAVEVLLARAAPAAPAAVATAALARIAALPGFLDAARATLRRPPVLLVDRALAGLGPAGELLVRAAGAFAPGLPDAEGIHAAVAGALAALARFGAALRDEIEPEPDWTAAALGEERLQRRIEEVYAVRTTPGDLARWAEDILDASEPMASPPDPAAPAEGGGTGGLPDARERSRLAAASAVRRTLRSRVAVEGWALYADLLEADAAGGRQRLRDAAARLLVDVGLHTGRTSPADAARLLVARAGWMPDAAEREVRRSAAEPAGGLAAAAGYREIVRLWQAWAAQREPDRRAFHAALLRYGALPPGLAAWGMGLQLSA